MTEPSTRRTAGLIVNPVAGMGGSVGLKGTDGGMHHEALALGARPVTPGRTRQFLSMIRNRQALRLLVAPGTMGAEYLGDGNIEFQVIGDTSGETTPEDTRRIARAMIAAGAELLVFVGGDGTARDIHDAVDLEVPVVAVPAGVKVYSSVFALHTEAAARMVDAFIDDDGVVEEEVLDIDEDAFREGRLEARHYGYLLVPAAAELRQGGKEASATAGSVAEAKREIAAYLVDGMDDETLYLLGPGTTLLAISEEMGLPGTLLGIDAVCGGNAIGLDLNEHAILGLLDRYRKAVIIVTPLGGNGFILGRGNKQLTPAVLRRVGTDGLKVVATRDKLLGLQCLRVDTDDTDLDRALSGYLKVTVGFNRDRVMRVAH